MGSLLRESRRDSLMILRYTTIFKNKDGSWEEGKGVMGRKRRAHRCLMQHQEAAGANEDMARQLMYIYSITYITLFGRKRHFFLAVENLVKEKC